MSTIRMRQRGLVWGLAFFVALLAVRQAPAGHSVGLRLWSADLEFTDKDKSVWKGGDALLYMLQYDYFESDADGGLAVSVLAGYGSGWKPERTTRVDLLGGAAYRYHLLTAGLGLHAVMFDQPMNQFGYAGPEGMLGLAIPLVAGFSCHVNGMLSALLWSGDHDTLGQDTGSTTGYGWDAGLDYSHSGVRLGAGYRAFHVSAATGNDNILRIKEEDFQGFYVFLGTVFY